MRLFRPWIAALLLPLMLLAGAVLADDAGDEKELDSLFAELRVAPGPAAAQAIGDRIWEIWTSPTDTVAAEGIEGILAARTNMDVAAALDLADRLIGARPDYAEGWNQRATIRYMVGDYAGSLADIKVVLELEPRHFGALTGRMLIHLQQGKRSLALLDIIEALKVHPFLAERGLFPELGEREI